MDTLTMTGRKKEATPNRQLAQAILDQYQPKSVEDMQDALKDIFGPKFEAMLQGEMNSHLGYSNNERGEKETVNRRNGYTKKTLKTTVGDVPIEVPRDREGTFEPAVVPKRKRDVSVVVKHFCNTLFENSPGISSFKWCFPIIVGMRTDMIVPYVHISV